MSLCVLIFSGIISQAQIRPARDSSDAGPLRVTNDSIGKDSLHIGFKNNKSALEDPVEYEAQDSIILDMKSKKVYLYGDAWITFQDIKLEADFIIVDFDNKSLFARGVINDTTGKYVGRPQFTDDGKQYEADSMKYNFESKKGLSMGALTTQQDGFIHGEKVLRDSLENIYVKNAKYTTCNLPEPHFYIKADKIKMIPKKQIVTGPANLVIEGINTPVFLPFGFFPIPDKRTHGIILPKFGESPNRGFYLRQLGYYIPINDYLDVQVSGDYYFRGSWGLAVNSRYYRKYKYRGSLGISYNLNEIGEPEIPSSYSVSNDIKINWIYNEDAKAKPGRTFSASVNFVTSNYLKNNTVNYNDIIATTSTSSVSYSKSLLKNKLNLSATSNIYQDLSRKDVSLTLPELTVNLSRQLPFSNAIFKNKTIQSFVRNFGFSYIGNFRNEIKVKEESLFTPQVLDSFRSGISHSIPLSTSFKAFKWFTLNPTFDYREFWYLKTTDKTWDDINETILVRSNVPSYERAYQYRFSLGLSTILYGYKEFRSGKIKAIRHVIRPRLSAAYNPDFNNGEKNGYQFVQNGDTTFAKYSRFENSVVGLPNLRPNASLNFGVTNNLEMKIRSKSDTTNKGEKKIKLIENLSLNSGYNFLADSLKLSAVSVTGQTVLFNKFRINFRTTIDPYFYDSSGVREYQVDEFLWERSDQFLRFTNSNISIATNLNPDAFKSKKSDKVDDDELDYINANLTNYVDFSIPWSLILNYNYTVRSSFYGEGTATQSITFSGDVSLTQKWKIGMSSGYDISEKAMSFTSFDFYRDLHCWEFSFSWYPIIRQQFEFSLRVKPGSLEALKLSRRRSWFDL